MPAEVATRHSIMGRIAVDTPLGALTVTVGDGAVTALDWGRLQDLQPAGPDGALLAESARQLKAYFEDGRFRFDLPLRPRGSTFQRAVWDFMLTIPAGETRTYGDCAAALSQSGTKLTPTGSVSAAQAVGGACGANPLPVIIPCHRIVAAGGAAGGYSGRGGLATKRHLLEHEGAWKPDPQGSLFSA